MYRRNRTFKTIKYNFGSATITPSDLELRWERSVRQNGRLLLKDHPHERMRSRVSGFVAFNQEGLATVGDAGGSVSNGWYGARPEGQVPIALSNQVYAKFRGKLYQGNAALGMTLATYRESRDLIVNRYGVLTNRAGAWADKLGKLRGRKLEKEIAGLHLEVIFGWTPLLEDIHAATTSVIQKAVPPQHVTSRATLVDRVLISRDSNQLHEELSSYITYRESWSTTVRISNPNLWLAERAGLLNPAAVAWDAVPWSFVVNMFVNTGQLVNSLSDFAGLTFESFSRTRTTNIQASLTTTRRWMRDPAGRVDHWRNTKRRELLSGPPGPRLSFRLPELSVGTCAMAASLFLQKFNVVRNFIPSSTKYRRA